MASPHLSCTHIFTGLAPLAHLELLGRGVVLLLGAGCAAAAEVVLVAVVGDVVGLGSLVEAAGGGLQAARFQDLTKYIFQFLD